MPDELAAALARVGTDGVKVAERVGTEGATGGEAEAAAAVSKKGVGARGIAQSGRVK